MMKSSLSKRVGGVIDKIYTDDSFKDVFLTHIPILKTKPETTVPVSLLECEWFRSDFYGLLSEKKVGREFWWFVTAYNGYKSPTEFISPIQEFKIPDWSYVTGLMNTHNTTHYN